MSTLPQVDPRIISLHKKGNDAFGTAKVFERRVASFRRKIQLLTFAGLAIPSIVGGIFLANVLNKPEYQKGLLDLAGILAAIQIPFAIWSLVANWPDRLENALSAASKNHRLSDDMKELAMSAAVALPADFDVRYAELKTRDDNQIEADTRESLSARETFLVHRFALMQFGLICDTCKTRPLSIKIPYFKKHCETCGGPLP